MTAPLATIAAMLDDVFPGTVVGRVDYLRWLYAQNPAGPALHREATDAEGVTAHYAVVPQTLLVDGVEIAAALSLNTAVTERARGEGIFTRLAFETFAAARAAGLEAVVGVANANSTPGFLGRLRFSSPGPLAATVLIPLPGRRSHVRTVDVVGDPKPLLAGVDEMLSPPRHGLTQAWTAESLAWRLRRPRAAYSLHWSPSALTISTVDCRKPTRVGIILACFARTDVPAAECRELVRAVCLHHRAPVSLHVGSNDRATFRGLPLPKRLRPAPLNLVLLDLADRDVEQAKPSRFEFLDFDAY